MDFHKTITVTGTARFEVPAERFVISPLSADTEIYVANISDTATENAALLGTTDANDYCTVCDVVPGTRFYLNTQSTFYVKY